MHLFLLLLAFILSFFSYLLLVTCFPPFLLFISFVLCLFLHSSPPLFLLLPHLNSVTLFHSFLFVSYIFLYVLLSFVDSLYCLPSILLRSFFSFTDFLFSPSTFSVLFSIFPSAIYFVCLLHYSSYIS